MFGACSEAFGVISAATQKVAGEATRRWDRWRPR
jgi:sigma54-dependent transcription regulator